MTSRELVKCAIRHRKPPRCPYSIGLTDDAWKVLQPESGCSDPDRFLDNDIHGVTPPWWEWNNLGRDWQGMDAPTSRPTVLGNGNFQEFVDKIKRVRDTQDKYILAMIFGSHFEKAYFSRGIENFMADLAGAPAFARNILNFIIERNLVMLENFLNIPEIDGVLLGSDWGSQIDLLMSPDCWHELIAPGEKKEYDLIHSYGKDVWVHSCGNVTRLIPSLVEMGVDVLNPIQPEAMDIARLKNDYGDRLTFWGGISTQRTLPFGTPDEVRTEARRIRDLLGAGGGYIFAPSQGIQDDVPPANVRALLEVAREDY